MAKRNESCTLQKFPNRKVGPRAAETFVAAGFGDLFLPAFFFVVCSVSVNPHFLRGFDSYGVKIDVLQ